MSSVIISGDTSGAITLSAPAVAGTNTLTLQAATATSSVNTLATAVASTSGTSIAFTGLPNWIKRITIMLNGVSTNGGSPVIVQFGTGATPTYTTTGYVSGNTTVNTTVGLYVHTGVNAADTRLGNCVLTHFGNNIWNSAAVGGFGNGGGTSTAGGYVSIGATITAIRITTVNGTDAFDAGSVNILYEG